MRRKCQLNYTLHTFYVQKLLSFLNLVCAYTTATINIHFVLCFVLMKISCLRKITSSARVKTGGFRKKNHAWIIIKYNTLLEKRTIGKVLKFSLNKVNYAKKVFQKR